MVSLQPKMSSCLCLQVFPTSVFLPVTASTQTQGPVPAKQRVLFTSRRRHNSLNAGGGQGGPLETPAPPRGAEAQATRPFVLFFFPAAVALCPAPHSLCFACPLAHPTPSFPSEYSPTHGSSAYFLPPHIPVGCLSSLSLSLLIYEMGEKSHPAHEFLRMNRKHSGARPEAAQQDNTEGAVPAPGALLSMPCE